MNHFLFVVLLLLSMFGSGQVMFSAPLVSPTERYKREILRLMVAEANRIAAELQLDEQLPITKKDLILVSLIPAAKSYGSVGVMDTRNYAYTMDMKDFGIVCSVIGHKGYADYLAAQTNYVLTISRFDSNHIFHVAMELMKKAGIDAEWLNRDCRVRIDFPKQKGLVSNKFSPIYMVSWSPKNKPFMPGDGGGYVEFIEPTRKVRALNADLKFNLRKPLETVNLVQLSTPENSLEAVLYTIEMATNLVRRIEFMSSGDPPESLLRDVWGSYTNAPFPTNVLFHTNAFEMFVRNLRLKGKGAIKGSVRSIYTNAVVR